MVKVIRGENDFESTYPDLVNKYWDFSKNDVLPSEVYYSSNTIKYWFRCEKGHSFNKTLNSFTRGVNGHEGPCPVCSGRLFVSGENDLETLRPEMLEYWDFDKNDINPQNIFYNDRKMKVWFKCSKGHSYSKTVKDMVRDIKSKTKGCPICSGKKIVSGENDFYHKYPELAKMWDYDKNDITPDKVNYKDRINSYWFICKKGHSFKSIPYDLVYRQKFSTKGCPICSGKRVVAGVNDIKTLFPERMKDWKYDLNPDLDPSCLPSNSTAEVYDICSYSGCSNVYKTQVQYWVRERVTHCSEHRLLLSGKSDAAASIANIILGVLQLKRKCIYLKIFRIICIL